MGANRGRVTAPTQVPERPLEGHPRSVVAAIAVISMSRFSTADSTPAPARLGAEDPGTAQQSRQDLQSALAEHLIGDVRVLTRMAAL